MKLVWLLTLTEAVDNAQDLPVPYLQSKGVGLCEHRDKNISTEGETMDSALLTGLCSAYLQTRPREKLCPHMRRLGKGLLIRSIAYLIFLEC